MATRKVRKMLRLRRMEFEKQVEKTRKKELLDGLTKADLIKYADECGVEVEKTAKKTEIKDKIIELLDKE